jgi:hypothetical protein
VRRRGLTDATSYCKRRSDSDPSQQSVDGSRLPESGNWRVHRNYDCRNRSCLPCGCHRSEYPWAGPQSAESPLLCKWPPWSFRRDGIATALASRAAATACAAVQSTTSFFRRWRTAGMRLRSASEPPVVDLCRHRRDDTFPAHEARHLSAALRPSDRSPPDAGGRAARRGARSRLRT